MGKTLIGGIINSLAYLKGLRPLNDLEKATADVKKSQEKALRGILSYSKDTVFGKEHKFSYVLEAKDFDELVKRYRECMNPCDYEYLRPYVERHIEGETDVLVPGKPAMFATTSGTTNKPKWIAISKKYAKNIITDMNSVWQHTVAAEGGVYGNPFPIVGKAIECYTKDNVPVGSVSGITREKTPKFILDRTTIPGYVSHISDYTARYYTMMRLSIEKDVTFIVTANPSTIVELLKNAEEYFDEYVKDIKNGTISYKFNIERRIREALETKVHPNPKRAYELLMMKRRNGGNVPKPKDYWPNLKVLNTWKCGNTEIYVNAFKGAFPETTKHVETGYFASECRFGVVFDEKSNYTVPFPHFHFLEFVEESQVGEKNPKFLLLHELEEGKNYCIYVTAYDGLYRYNMNDLIQCGPRYKDTPTIKMVQKVNGIVNITGEKLYEKQFIQAVKIAESRSRLHTRFFVGFTNLESSTYDFFYEFENENVSQHEAEEFTNLVDQALKESNIEYQDKRKSHRLTHPITHRLHHDSFRFFKKESLKRGARDGQFKLVQLMQDENKKAIFNEWTENEDENKE